jgi:sugar lactone lactonase YvrE
MQTKTKTMSQFIGGTICAGTLLLGSLGAEAQNIFVGNYNSILEFSPSGGGSFNQTTFAGGLDYARSLAFDSAGDLFEADCYSGQIFEFVNHGGKLNSSPVVFADHLQNPCGMAFDKAGDLFVAANPGNFIYEFTPGTGMPTVFATGVEDPYDMAFDSRSNLYVSNLHKGTITEITPSGVQSIFASGLNNPDGLAFNAARDLFVSDSSPYDAITEIAPNGIQSTYVTGLNNPQELAFDSQGNLFVADDGTSGGNTGDLIEIAPDKTKTVISSSVGNPLGLAIRSKPHRRHWLLVEK